MNVHPLNFQCRASTVTDGIGRQIGYLRISAMPPCV
jgi:hypothetical protein